MEQKDIVIKIYRKGLKYYNKCKITKITSNHIFVCEIIQTDKQVVFEHSGNNFNSSVKFCIKRDLGHWWKHLRKGPQILERDWQVSLCQRNAKGGNINSASNVSVNISAELMKTSNDTQCKAVP